MYETLTPRENLTFAAAFILPKVFKENRSKEVDEEIYRIMQFLCWHIHLASHARHVNHLSRVGIQGWVVKTRLDISIVRK